MEIIPKPSLGDDWCAYPYFKFPISSDYVPHAAKEAFRDFRRRICARLASDSFEFAFSEDLELCYRLSADDSSAFMMRGPDYTYCQVIAELEELNLSTPPPLWETELVTESQISTRHRLIDILGRVLRRLQSPETQKQSLREQRTKKRFERLEAWILDRINDGSFFAALAARNK